jgi:hypothetical protein
MSRRQLIDLLVKYNRLCEEHGIKGFDIERVESVDDLRVLYPDAMIDSPLLIPARGPDGDEFTLVCLWNLESQLTWARNAEGDNWPRFAEELKTALEA